jgi:hypothetical protein
MPTKVAHADEAMYAGKRSNQWAYFHAEKALKNR